MFSKPNTLDYFPMAVLMQSKAPSNRKQEGLFQFQLLKKIAPVNNSSPENIIFCRKQIPKGITFFLNLNLFPYVCSFLALKASQSLPFSSMKYLNQEIKNISTDSVCVLVTFTFSLCVYVCVCVRICLF